MHVNNIFFQSLQVKNDDDVYTMLMCNEQYSCVGPTKLLCTINRTSNDILNLLQSTITPTYDAILYYNEKWNISRQSEFLGYSFTRTNPIRFDIPSRCSMDKLNDTIKQVAPLGVSPYHMWSNDCFFNNQVMLSIQKINQIRNNRVKKWRRRAKCVNKIQLWETILSNRNFKLFLTN